MWRLWLRIYNLAECIRFWDEKQNDFFKIKQVTGFYTIFTIFGGATRMSSEFEESNAIN